MMEKMALHVLIFPVVFKFYICFRYTAYRAYCLDNCIIYKVILLIILVPIRHHTYLLQYRLYSLWCTVYPCYYFITYHSLQLFTLLPYPYQLETLRFSLCFMSLFLFPCSYISFFRLHM